MPAAARYATQKDCCGCVYEVVYREFYYLPSSDWLARRLRNFDCCVGATLSFTRLLNLLFILYSLFITGFCLLTWYGPVWLPERFATNNTFCSTNPSNCTQDERVFNGGGWDNLRVGGAVFWAIAVCQGLAALWLGPLPFCGHLNSICCGTRSMPVLQAAAAFDFILFLCCVALIVVTLVPESVIENYFPKWTRNEEQMMWLVTVGVDGLALLLAFALSVSLNNNFLVPATTREEPKGKVRPADNNNTPQTKSKETGGGGAVEMVAVTGGESKTTATTEAMAAAAAAGGGGGDKKDHAGIVRSWSDEIDAGNGLDSAMGAGGGPPSWEIPPEQVEDGQMIGEGFFGQCFKAKWNEQLVVVKRFKNGIRGEGADAARKNFHREVAILVQLRHPRICQFLGACARPDNLFIVLESVRGTACMRAVAIFVLRVCVCVYFFSRARVRRRVQGRERVCVQARAHSRA